MVPQDLDAIIAIWQPSSPKPLTAEDGREIAENVTGFFALLARWRDQDRPLGPGGSGVNHAPS